MSDQTPAPEQGQPSATSEPPSTDELGRQQEALAEEVRRHLAVIHGQGTAQ